MKKHVGFLRLTGLLLCLCVFLSACGRKESGSLDGYLFQPKQPVNLSEVRVQGDTLENESFRLELLNNYSEVRLTDKATGDVWSFFFIAAPANHSAGHLVPVPAYVALSQERAEGEAEDEIG